MTDDGREEYSNERGVKVDSFGWFFLALFPPVNSNDFECGKGPVLHFRIRECCAV